jgi:hypothetical protein
VGIEPTVLSLNPHQKTQHNDPRRERQYGPILLSCRESNPIHSPETVHSRVPQIYRCGPVPGTGEARGQLLSAGFIFRSPGILSPVWLKNLSRVRIRCRLRLRRIWSASPYGVTTLFCKCKGMRPQPSELARVPIVKVDG